uniref:Uncharacterized protein n=1 Tax=Daphnia galeata TaxID=27404 RepID=A0A8J2RNH7_9CRUS|nr:unnamed protein product [Daphnia galeata]
MVYHDMKKQSKEPQTDEPAFHESDLNEVSTDINIPQEISIPLDDAQKEGAIINNEAIDEEIVYDASPNASNASPRVDSGRQVNSKGTRQSARRPKLSDRYLQYRQSIAKQEFKLQQLPSIIGLLSPHSYAMDSSLSMTSALLSSASALLSSVCALLQQQALSFEHHELNEFQSRLFELLLELFVHYFKLSMLLHSGISEDHFGDHARHLLKLR